MHLMFTVCALCRVSIEIKQLHTCWGFPPFTSFSGVQTTDNSVRVDRQLSSCTRAHHEQAVGRGIHAPVHQCSLALKRALSFLTRLEGPAAPQQRNSIREFLLKGKHGFLVPKQSTGGAHMHAKSTTVVDARAEHTGVL